MQILSPKPLSGDSPVAPQSRTDWGTAGKWGNDHRVSRDSVGTAMMLLHYRENRKRALSVSQGRGEVKVSFEIDETFTHHHINCWITTRELIRTLSVNKVRLSNIVIFFNTDMNPSLICLQGQETNPNCCLFISLRFNLMRLHYLPIKGNTRRQIYLII